MAKDVKPGDRFGRLVVLGDSRYTPQPRNGNQGKSRPGVLVRCDCGNEKVVAKGNLLRPNTRSCGCLHREQLAAMMTTHGATAGGVRSPLYRVWKGMRSRCQDPKAQNYKWYGGRGITICDAWQDFSKFRDWSEENGYEPGMQLDRENNDLGYSPDNCQWVTRIQNLQGRRLYLPPDLETELRSRSDASGVPMYQLVREAVSHFLHCDEVGLERVTPMGGDHNGCR